LSSGAIFKVTHYRTQFQTSEKIRRNPHNSLPANRNTHIHPSVKLIDEMTAARQAESTSDWEAEFPGTSPGIITLRGCLIQADQHRRLAQTAFDQLQTILDATCLPMLHWKCVVHSLYDRFCRQKSQAERDFFRALTIIRKLFSPTKSAAYNQPETPPRTAQSYRDHGSTTHSDQQQFNRAANRRR
jgi:hypothetical protein